MQRYEHWKHKNIYRIFEVPEGNLDQIHATHHETQELMMLTKSNDGTFLSEKGEVFEVYFNEKEKDPQLWAREYDDFHGYKEFEDGSKVKKFVLLPEEMKFERQKADIKAPANYKDIIDSTLKSYKKWLKETDRFLEIADTAETEEDRKEALHKNTQHFRKRFAGVVGIVEQDQLSVSQLKNIWEKFMKTEYREFLNAHLNLSLEQIMKVGIDKFIHVMGWRKPSDVPSWHNNKLRVGVCCHCNDQFIPMMFQHNHGLCANCRPLYSVKAIRNFAIHQLNSSERYHEAQHDLLMDFYIIFYHDEKFRKLFLVGSDTTEIYENLKEEVPEWAIPERAKKEISEGEVVETTNV